MQEKKVVGVFSAPKGVSGGTRPKVQKLVLIKDFGIENDKFAMKDLEKTVMIVGINSYELSQSNDIKLNFGSLGENILLNFDPHLLEIGTILQIADAKIQITQKCTICNHLAEFGECLPMLLKNCRGLYCKILENGEVVEGSSVKVLGN